jgi:hypothetical protein
MGRFGFKVAASLVTGLIAVFVGCGGSVPPTPGFGVPAVIKLSPTPTLSVELGSTTQLSATALSGTKAPLAATFTYRSSNPNIVSVASNGLACAGTWDSVTTPIVCTPGGVGTATVTASSSGVVSAPTTVYVHQHIAQISITALPILSPPLPFPANPPPLGFPFPAPQCYTAAAGSTLTAQTQMYDASAMADDVSGHPTVDISSTVGPFSWSASQPTVATLTPLSTMGIPNGQVQVTAHEPGLTQIFAAIADTTSAPLAFMTCPVQTIALAVNGIGGDTITGAKGTSSSIAATVYDIAGNAISPTLTWTSSDATVAAVSTTGGVTSPGVGGASIIASCIAPTCNINLSPPQSIYPPVPVGATYTGTTSTPFSVYVASSATKSASSCATNAHCEAFLVPISGNPPLAATPVLLTGSPSEIPNSIQFVPSGATAYMGSQKGLMAVATSANPPTITTTPRVTGQVLAISPDSKLVIVSDTSSAVQQVFVFNTAASTFTNFQISGATAAAFSPDSSKAYIVAGSTLYIYSTQSAFQAAPLHAPGTDVAFLANGMYGYVAETSGTDLLATCTDPSQPLSSQVQSVAAPISFIRPLIDGSGFVGLQPPNSTLTSINASIAPTTLPLAAGDSGCPAPFTTGQFSVSNTVNPLFSFGPGTPIAFLLSSDAQKVYIVVQNSPTIQVFDLLTQLPSTLSLVGSPNPLAAALAPDGQTLYVSGSDGKVHFVNTVSGGDVSQVDVPASSLCTITTGGTQPNCLPDLLAVKL